ncbi:MULTISPECIES: type I restriction endonuclease [Pseudomonas syringae group]|uniref:type I restriction endonuclease n=1 Tax=Pseudomonas syringae group TaxID=136849 RepID=UPI0006D62744|nr:type I restriction endonuclease [Pseudomonas coronafaciens]
MENIYQGLGLNTESDVEQKLLYPLMNNPSPMGLGYAPIDIRTKADIRKIKIDKGNKGKLYFPDYALIINGLPFIIVEAKTPGEDLNEAFREARLYATEINASYPRNTNPCEIIIASDGIKLIAGFWDKDDPEVTLTTEDINPLNPLFTDLYELCSKKNATKRTDAILKSIKSSATYFKPIQMLGGKAVENETVGENSFGANVSIEYKYLFNPETLEDRASVAENAYVTSSRKDSHIAPINKIIRAALPVIAQGRLVKDTATAKEILDQVSNIPRIRNEICLLIGSVGSGKSTFTDYMRLQALPKHLVESTIWINVNLNKAPLSRDEIYTWVVDQCIQLLKATASKLDFDSIEMLKRIYSVELGRVERGRASLYPKDSEKYIDAIYKEIERLQNSPHDTLNGIINYLCTGGEKLLIIVLDNCDKRNRDDQLLMFEVASWLKQQFPCMIFLPLRDTTYDQFRNEPPLDTVIKDLVFRIDPPLLERVIYERLNYALRVINNQQSKFVYSLPNNMQVECSRNEVATYIQAMISSLFQDAFFKRIITGLAGRNIRKGLEILLDFCKSGHIGEDELLKARQTLGDYKLPYHLIAKILLKSKRKYYSDSESHIKNVFSSDDTDALPNPFIRLAILTWLRSMSREYGPNRTKGFHKLSTLVKSMQSAGHSEERTRTETTLLIDAGCILCEAQTHVVSDEDLISIAPAGLIHLDLVRNIDYLSTISEDVFFRENQPARKIADNLIGKGPFKINSRQTAIDNSATLVRYLSSYHQKFFVGPAKVLTDDSHDEFLEINILLEYVTRTSENDEAYSKLHKLEAEYPEGLEVEAQIVSVQNYGVFVEFGLEGRGLVRKPSHSHILSKVFNNFETGDWISVRVGKYSGQHNGFTLTLT